MISPTRSPPRFFRLQVSEAPPTPTPQAGKYLLNKFDFDHPLFSPYKQFTADKLPQAEFLGHFRTVEEASTRVLARFSDNMPAVLEGSVGKGKALLYTFSLDNRFSDLVNRPFMVILLNRSIEYLVSEPLNQRENIVSGTEVTRELSAQNARQFALVTPDERHDSAFTGFPHRRSGLQSRSPADIPASTRSSETARRLMSLR